jgi:hypothetical protein
LKIKERGVALSPRREKRHWQKDIGIIPLVNESRIRGKEEREG